MVKGPEPARTEKDHKTRKFIAATSTNRNTHKSTFDFISLYSQLTQMAPHSLILLWELGKHLLGVFAAWCFKASSFSKVIHSCWIVLCKHAFCYKTASETIHVHNWFVYLYCGWVCWDFSFIAGPIHLASKNLYLGYIYMQLFFK